MGSHVRSYSSFAIRVSYLTLRGLSICLPLRVTPNDIAVGWLVVYFLLVAMIKTYLAILVELDYSKGAEIIHCDPKKHICIIRSNNFTAL